MKTCKNCRFYDGQVCKMNGQRRAPYATCNNFVEYKGN